jgi:hypothetical protein
MKKKSGLSSASDRDIQLKSQDGATARISRVTGTVSDLKEQVSKTQRLFFRKAQGSDVKPEEDWRTLGICGATR